MEQNNKMIVGTFKDIENYTTHESKLVRRLGRSVIPNEKQREMIQELVKVCEIDKPINIVNGSSLLWFACLVFQLGRDEGVKMERKKHKGVI